MTTAFKLSLKSQLGGVIGIIVFIAVGIGLLGLYGMGKSDEGLRSVYQNRTLALEQISRIDMLLVQCQLSLAEALQDSMVVTINAKSALIDKNVAEINQIWAGYIASDLPVPERQLAEKFATDRSVMLNDTLLLAMKTMRDGDLAAANDLQTKVEKMAPGVRASADALRSIQVNGAQREYVQSRSRYTFLSSSMITAIVAGTLLAVLLARLLIQTIYRQLGGEPDYAAHIVHSLSEGNLAVQIVIKPHDQGSLLYAMKIMQANLANTVGDIRDSTVTITQAAGEIVDGNIDLSRRSEKQAGVLEETSASMTLLTSSVHQNATYAAQANQFAIDAMDVALKGNEAVVQVVSSMRAIDQSSRKISDIISVIDGIAFQTNILALNAAVEAARAGEQGRGFAVVATEVRDLAQRSASAAKEIKQLITNSVSEVSIGTALAEQAGVRMEEIVMSVKHVTTIMHDISLSGQEQHAGIRQVNEAVIAMDRATQKNAVLVQEATSASDLLKDQALRLSALVDVFTLVATSEPAVVRMRSRTVTYPQSAHPLASASQLSRLASPVRN